MKTIFALILLVPALTHGGVSAQQMSGLCEALHKEILASEGVEAAYLREQLSEKGFVLPSDFVMSGLLQDAFQFYQAGDLSKDSNKSCEEAYVFLQNEEDKLNSQVAEVQVTLPILSPGGGIGNLFGAKFTRQFKIAPHSRPQPVTRMNDCESVLSFEACKKEDFQKDGIFDFAKDWMAKIGNEKQNACNCLSKKLEQDYLIKPGQLEKDRKEVRRKIRSALLNQLGKKFLNDYSSNIENITFYTTSIPGIFGKNQKEQEEKAQLLQCSEASIFENAIKKKCGAKIDPDKQNKRIAAIFDAHKINSGLRNEPKDELGNLSARFTDLNKQISILDNTPDGSYTRFDHDSFRASLSKTDPRHKFTDSLIRKVMQNKDFAELIKSDPKPPFESISNELFQMARENPEKFARTFLNEKEMGSGFYNEFVKSIKSDVATVDNNIFRFSLGQAMGLHPGIESILRDKKLFYEALEIAKDNKQTLTSAVENKDSGLLEKYQAQCKDMVNNFADIVCLDDNKMNELIASEQAVALVPLTPEKEDLVRELMCKSEGNGRDSDLLDNLMMDNPLQKTSDFHDRKSYSIAGQTNPFRLLYSQIKNKNSEVLTVLNDSMKQTEGTRKSLRGKGIISDFYGSSIESRSSLPESLNQRKSEASSNTAQKNDQTSELSQSTASNVSKDLFQSPLTPQAQSQVTPAFQTAGLAAPQASTQATTDSKSPRDVRREFREFLANESNKENVDRLVSGADDTMMTELMKLRDEYSRNQTRLAELTNEHEKLKLKMMEDQMRTLEEQRSQLVPGPDKKESRERTAEGSGITEAKREVASVTQVDTGSASAGVSSGSSAGVSAGGSSSAGTAGGKGSLSSPSGSQKAIALGTERDSAPAVIFSSKAAQASGLTIESSELSNDVISYLENSSVDINTLLKMKTSGVMYRYKVLEDGSVIEKEMLIDYQSLNANAKKMIDQKIAAKGIDVRQLDKIEGEMRKLKRSYTYNSLKVLLGEQLKR